MLTEREFSKQVVSALESAGSWCFNVHGHRFQKSGTPDVYVANIRWTGWIEFKVGSSRPRPLQIMTMKDLLVRGVPAFVVRLKDGVVYCELWGGDSHEVLAYCKDWRRDKGTTRGLCLLTMFNDAGKMAIKIMKGL